MSKALPWILFVVAVGVIVAQQAGWVNLGYKDPMVAQSIARRAAIEDTAQTRPGEAAPAIPNAPIGAPLDVATPAPDAANFPTVNCRTYFFNIGDNSAFENAIYHWVSGNHEADAVDDVRRKSIKSYIIQSCLENPNILMNQIAYSWRMQNNVPTGGIP